MTSKQPGTGAPVSAVILAGGRSSRMGRSKAELPFGGGTFLSCQADKLRALGIRDIVVSGYPAPPEGVRCVGDTRVDDHHSTEDIGIALGEAFRRALGDKRGICRYGSILLPMDEALVACAVDLSGRSLLRYDLTPRARKVGTFDTELVEEFFLAFTRTAGMTLHIKQLDGKNTHHILEAAFKGVGRALRQAVAVDADAADEIPSTKGTLA